MFKPVIVAKKSWWVPERNSQLLAVQIDQPEEYQQAVRWKMANLAKEWGLERALDSANHYLRQDGATYLPTPGDEEQLVQFVLENNSRIQEMVNAGDPAVSKPADLEDAQWAVKDQELNWEDFLTSGGEGFLTSSEGSGDELGGLSELDLDNIFDNLGKTEKPKGGPRAPMGDTKGPKEPRAPKGPSKGQTVIPEELEGLGLEELLNELDEALNGKPTETPKGVTPEDSEGLR